MKTHFGSLSTLFFVCALLVTFCAALIPANAQETEKHRTGRFTIEEKGIRALNYGRAIHFYGAELSPGIGPRILAGEVKWILRKDPVVYNVVVPDSYKPEYPHGVLAWIDSVDGGRIPPEFAKLLSKHRIIAIGAAKSGNTHPTPARHAMAVSGAHVIAERYNIDPDRVYVTGRSGGGRVASQVMIMDGELFTGGIPIVGANPCIKMENAIRTGDVYMDLGHWKKPDQRILSLVQERSRLAFLTGDGDYNRHSVKKIYEGYTKAGFNTLYLEEPGIKHGMLSSQWLEKAILFLDAPLRAASTKVFKSAEAAEKSGKIHEAYASYLKAYLHGSGLPFNETAGAKIGELREQVNQLSREELDALIADKKTTLAKYQNFKQQWQGFQGADLVDMEINKLGLAELETLKAAKPKKAKSSMRAYFKKWRDYEVYDEAVEFFDTIAVKELEEVHGIQKESTRHKKLILFAKIWAPTKSSDAAWEQVNQEGRVILDKILAEPNPTKKGRQLMGFIKAYKGADISREAEEILKPETKAKPK